jgi:hypothetical protein
MREENNMESKTKIKWLATPEEQGYTAAESYLSLIYDSKTVAKLSHQLKKAPVFEFKAKDIFRASGLSLLGVSNSHVKKDRKKILAGLSLSLAVTSCKRPNQWQGCDCRWLSSHVLGIWIR